jgi:hypothetical protein
VTEKHHAASRAFSSMERKLLAFDLRKQLDRPPSHARLRAASQAALAATRIRIAYLLNTKQRPSKPRVLRKMPRIIPA